ncbi:MmgE/PrpD family protein [Fusibacter ferrireducens]|uniref:MmgE/PrpD family protein n=1 Tax=Fusibacter ferrireducens TaxID=2785058 RepID=A0ABR9ZQB0_9FIRM|nr:MmgE/PrpD family protein [Fusibacter ferrireducens]MBF4692115.1 MmgE/PrpD family protein [Fusibacter ferrireducens]
MSEIRNLARYVNTFSLDQVDEKTVQNAKNCIIDTLGCTIGASKYNEIPKIIEVFNDISGESIYNASIFGHNQMTGVMRAIFYNGIMSHALELDDVHTGSKAHVGAVVVITAYALSEAFDLSGKDFLSSVIVGYDVMSRIGMGMNVVSHRKKGFHATGIIGTFGASAVASYLLGLDEDQTVSAFGMAGTQSSGLWAFLAEGSSCKKLHVARAAVNGVEAALLSKSGMTGPEGILTATDGGLYRAMSDGFEMSKVDENLGKVYEINHIDKKPYPCCRSIHHAIDAALILAESDKLHEEDIEKIIVETYDVAVLQCGFENYPVNTNEAKFSIAYCVSVAIINGRVTQTEFSDKVHQDTATKALSSKVSVVESKLFSDRYPERWGCRMTVILNNGRELIQQIDDISGSVANPLSLKQQKEKFYGLLENLYPEKKIENLYETLLKIDKLEKMPKIY